eukprot:jgi/Astpho2/2517/e_gw1.00048.124.1_t
MTTCKGCGMVYSPGHAADEAQHAQFHKSLTTGIRCQDWPNTRVVLDDRKQGRVLLVQPGDSSAALSKVREVAAMLENQLGLHSVWLLAGTWQVHLCLQAFLYVTPASRLVGCVVAEPLSHAYAPTAARRPSDCRQAASSLAFGSHAPKQLRQGHTGSRELPLGTSCPPRQQWEAIARLIKDTSRRMPASCGIRAVWTSVESRRQGVATKLLDACRSDALPLDLCIVAFTQPTEAGAKLAASYSGTAAFLVY